MNIDRGNPLLFGVRYGSSAPIEVEIPSLRVMADVKLHEAKWIQARLDQLNLIEEKRMTTLCHVQLYHKRLKKAFDKRVHPQNLQVGDLVLKKIMPTHTDPRGTWTPNYEGPYIVR